MRICEGINYELWQEDKIETWNSYIGRASIVAISQLALVFPLFKSDKESSICHVPQENVLLPPQYLVPLPPRF
jgi:hypothetical protein